MYKQVIIARKDIMKDHPGKLAAQCCHASMAFLTSQMKKYHEIPNNFEDYLKCSIFVKEGMYKEWINGSFTKTILQAKNKSHLLKAKTMAEEMGMIEGKEFFLIYDNCKTVFTPEENDNTTLSCIGFIPMDNEIIDKIGRKYHLYV